MPWIHPRANYAQTPSSAGWGKCCENQREYRRIVAIITRIAQMPANFVAVLTVSQLRPMYPVAESDQEDVN
jgi:hypothetical protein